MENYLISKEIDEHLKPILYILNRVNRPVNKYNLLKILYFADQLCLVNYNQKVTNDWYEKNEYGPVAYHTYDILKAVEGKNDFMPKELFSDCLRKVGLYEFEALKKVDLDEFSKAQMECLDKAIEENINLSFSELKDKSHDEAYELTEDIYGEIDKYAIAKAGGATDEQIEYMKEVDNFKNSQWF